MSFAKTFETGALHEYSARNSRYFPSSEQQYRYTSLNNYRIKVGIVLPLSNFVFHIM